MGRRARIIFVDDEIALVEAFAEYLDDLGHDTVVAASGRDLDFQLAQGQADLIVLDLKMPGENGIDILRRLNRAGVGPIILLTAHAEPVDRIVALELGADDVVAKPVDPRELAARCLSVLSRYNKVDRELVRFENASVDLTASCLLRDGSPPERLGPGEVMLVRAFAGHPNKVLSREDLLQLAPAESFDVNDKAVDSRVARLRGKLGTEAIVTIRGRGYMFQPPEPSGGNAA